MPLTGKKQDKMCTIVAHLCTEPSGNIECSHKSASEEEAIVAEITYDESGDEASSVKSSESNESSEESVHDFDETPTTQKARMSLLIYA